MYRNVLIDPTQAPQQPEEQYTKRGERFLRRLQRAARKESWGSTIARLAWTAGPVTYLALQGGYLLGYGQSAPPQVVIYFAIYTVVAGVIAIVFRFAYNVVRGSEIEEDTAALREVLEKLPELVHAARNTNIEAYDEEGQVTLSAKYILENPDASPDGVSLAVFELTGDRELAYDARSAELLRRMGFHARIRHLYNRVSSRLEGYLEDIESRSERVAQLVRNRFIGLAPEKKRGRSRTEGFIERFLAAGEEDNNGLVTLSDVEEAFTLAFELLAGRSFRLYTLEYTGHRVFTELSERLDRARRELRAAIHVRNNRLRALAEFLNGAPEIQGVAAAVPVLSSAGEVYGGVAEAIERLYEDISQSNFGSDARMQHNRERHRTLALWKETIELYQALYRSNLELRKKHLALYRAVKNYESAQSRRKFRLRLLGPDQRGQGIRIRRTNIGLNTQQRLVLARDLRRTLSDVAVRERFQRAVVSPPGERHRYLSPGGYKELALEVLLKIERHLPIERPRVQYAVEGTNAPNLGSLETNLTHQVKIGWGVSIVQELEQDSRRAVERLVGALVYYHGVELDERALRYLQDEFDVEQGRIYNQNIGEERRRPVPSPAIQEQLIHIPPLPQEYGKLYERLQWAASSRGRQSARA